MAYPPKKENGRRSTGYCVSQYLLASIRLNRVPIPAHRQATVLTQPTSCVGLEWGGPISYGPWSIPCYDSRLPSLGLVLN